MRGFSSYSIYLFILTQSSINSVVKSFNLLFSGNRMLWSILLCNWIEICHLPFKCEASAIVHFPLNLFYLSISPYIISFNMILSAKVRWAKQDRLFMLSLTSKTGLYLNLNNWWCFSIIFLIGKPTAVHPHSRYELTPSKKPTQNIPLFSLGQPSKLCHFQLLYCPPTYSGRKSGKKKKSWCCPRIVKQ